MLTILGMAIGVILVFLFAGMPFALFTVNSFFKDVRRVGPLALAVALIFGFGISAFSATTAYGLIGIDSYLVIFAAVSICGWILLLLNRNKAKTFMELLTFAKTDLLIAIPIFFSIAMARTQWFGLNGPGIRSGSGTDLSQNLMAAESARTLNGNTWFQQAHYFNAFFGHNSLSQSIFDIFRLPSFRDQAGVDYLLYGTRWGLTVPASQMLRFFGPQSILWETGIVLLISLIALSIIIYATVTQFTVRKDIPILAAITAATNTAFLYEYVNGGLSQAFAVAGAAGIFLTMFLILNVDFTKDYRRKFIALNLLAAASWVIVDATYMDMGLILVLAIAAACVLALWSYKEKAKQLFLVMSTSLVASTLITPTLTYVMLSGLKTRLKAASGTGGSALYWPLPSELYGYLDGLLVPIGKSKSIHLFLGFLLTALILTSVRYYFIRNHQVNLPSLLLLSSLVISIFGWILSWTGHLHTSYIYTKVAVYIAPLVISSLYLTFSSHDKIYTKGRSTNVKRHGFNFFIPSILTSIAVGTALYSTSYFIKEGNNISMRPYYSKLLSDKNLRKELSYYNYLIPYHSGYETFGILSDVHWVSKATNDQVLTERLDIPLRLMCYVSDTTCAPNSKKIPNDFLEKNFGIVQFESPITIQKFAKLSPTARYAANFAAFNQPAQEIPSRMIGGNPYFQK